MARTRNAEAEFDIALELPASTKTSRRSNPSATPEPNPRNARRYASQESMRDDPYKAKVTAAANLRETGRVERRAKAARRQDVAPGRWHPRGKRIRGGDCRMSSVHSRLAKFQRGERELLVLARPHRSIRLLPTGSHYVYKRTRWCPRGCNVRDIQRAEGDKVLYRVAFRTPISSLS